MVLLIIVAVSVLGVLVFIGLTMNSGVTGNAVFEEEETIGFYAELNLAAKIFLLLQFLLLFALAIYYIIKTQMAMKERVEISNFDIIKNPGRSKTDIDTLYTILKEKKKIRIPTVAKAFKVDDDIAMEWCRILEIGDLAEIEYPGFIGEPSVKILDQVEEDVDKYSPIKVKESKPEVRTGLRKEAESIAGESKAGTTKPSTTNPVTENSTLTEKDKKWAKDAIARGLKREQAQDLLKSIDSKKAEEIIKYYDELSLQN